MWKRLAEHGLGDIATKGYKGQKVDPEWTWHIEQENIHLNGVFYKLIRNTSILKNPFEKKKKKKSLKVS